MINPNMRSRIQSVFRHARQRAKGSEKWDRSLLKFDNVLAEISITTLSKKFHNFIRKQIILIYIYIFICFLFLFFNYYFFLIQFNVPFKIISAHMRRANQ